MVLEEGKCLGRNYIYLLILVILAKVFWYSFCNRHCAKQFT